MNVILIENEYKEELYKYRELAKAAKNIFKELSVSIELIVNLIEQAIDTFKDMISELYEGIEEQKEREIKAITKRAAKCQEKKDIKSMILDMLYSVRKNKPPERIKRK